MASGRLSTLDITSAATDTQLYAAPSGKTVSFNLCITNRTGAVVKIRIALTSSTTIHNDEYIAYDVSVYPNEVYERSGLVIKDGQFVYVRSSATGTNAVMYGYEE